MARRTFDTKKLDEIYNIVKADNGIIGESVGYKVGNNSFSFVEYAEWNNYYTEITVFIDNFPSQKRFYRLTIPVKTLEELEFVFKMAGLELERKEKQYYVMDISKSHDKYCVFHSRDCGYTNDLDKAQRYTEQEAESVTMGSDLLKQYECKSVDFSSQRTILKPFLPAGNAKH